MVVNYVSVEFIEHIMIFLEESVLIPFEEWSSPAFDPRGYEAGRRGAASRLNV